MSVNRPRERFESLAALVYEPLQRYARRRTDAETAADVVAESLTVLWRRLDDVPPGNELAWSYGVARRCLANARRSARRGTALVERLESAARTSAPAVESRADEELWEALDQLRPDDREVLRLWAWEQLTPAEIALVMELTPNATSIRLHRAKARLAELLTARKDAEGPGHRPDAAHESTGEEAGT